VQASTNSLPVVAPFGDFGAVETIVTGGSILPQQGMPVGHACGAALEQVRAELAILAGTGVTERGVWNDNALLISTLRQMIEAADWTVFALDALKFGRKALSLTPPFGPRINFVTDTPPAPAVAAAITAGGARLALAGG